MTEHTETEAVSPYQLSRLVLCRNCRAEFDQHSSKHEFCSNKCRADHHRHHMPAGRVMGVRRLMNGKVSVTVHFDENLALRYNVGQRVTVGEEG